MVHWFPRMSLTPLHAQSSCPILCSNWIIVTSFSMSNLMPLFCYSWIDYVKLHCEPAMEYQHTNCGLLNVSEPKPEKDDDDDVEALCPKSLYWLDLLWMWCVFPHHLQGPTRLNPCTLFCCALNLVMHCYQGSFGLTVGYVNFTNLVYTDDTVLMSETWPVANITLLIWEGWPHGHAYAW